MKIKLIILLVFISGCSREGRLNPGDCVYVSIGSETVMGTWIGVSDYESRVKLSYDKLWVGNHADVVGCDKFNNL